MNIENRPITALRPYPNNPRLNDDAVAAVAESIRRFGFRQPIVVDLRRSGARLVDSNAILADVAAGAPVNADGSVNLLAAPFVRAWWSWMIPRPTSQRARRASASTARASWLVQSSGSRDQERRSPESCRAR